MSRLILLLALILLAGCAAKAPRDDSSTLVSMQVVDRNGFSETMSSSDRISGYQKIDFMTPQPYKKVLRVFGRNVSGKNPSKITSYHPNGQVWQYLEVIDGRANGMYREWFSNSQLKLEIKVIEGVADINEMAQASWVFDGKSSVYDDEGNLIAEITYDKGMLETPSFYYHANKQLKQKIPYRHNEIDGLVESFDEQGILIEKSEYRDGLRHGSSLGLWPNQTLKFQETHKEGLLLEGLYQNQQGDVLGEVRAGYGMQAIFNEGKLESIIEYKSGLAEGKVDLFAPDGALQCTYMMKNEQKNGEEWEYYPLTRTKGSLQPKLFLFWQDDSIQGVVKTWYENGVMESQKEINNNKKQGLSFAWYRDGSLMLMEEYDKDVLFKGSYFKKGEKNPISKVEEGKGIATLYSSDGHLLKKVNYDKGKPQLD